MREVRGEEGGGGGGILGEGLKRGDDGTARPPMVTMAAAPSVTGSNSDPMERWRLPLLETPLELCTESVLRHLPVRPRPPPSSLPGMLELAWFQDSLLWMLLSLPSTFLRSSMVPAVWYRLVSGPALPGPRFPLASSSATGSEITVICGPKAPQPGVSVPERDLTRGGFRCTGGWMAAERTRDLGLRGG